MSQDAIARIVLSGGTRSIHGAIKLFRNAANAAALPSNMCSPSRAMNLTRNWSRAMIDHNLIFSAPMVRALLAGHKTQTRQPLKSELQEHFTKIPELVRMYPNQKYVGWDIIDRIWVRENLEAYNLDLGGVLGLTKPLENLDMTRNDVCARYSADRTRCQNQDGFDLAWIWKKPTQPAMFMPRGFSRLTLIVTGVKIERLQDISEEDAIAEGTPEGTIGSIPSRIAGFADYWALLHGQNSWAANPFVAAISFRVIKANIDSLPQKAA